MQPYYTLSAAVAGTRMKSHAQALYFSISVDLGQLVREFSRSIEVNWHCGAILNFYCMLPVQLMCVTDKYMT